MRILYIGLKNDYGDPRRGWSYEYLNFFGALSRMAGVEISFFPFDEVMRNFGRKQMNAHLLHTVEQEEPDLCFFVLFTDEIAQETIRSISDIPGVTTLLWLTDDHWQFRVFSRYWAGLFRWIVTTDSSALQKYMDLGLRNVIKSQWGFNHLRFAPPASPRRFGVTFVGQVHSRRRKMVNLLRDAGVDVKCWGKGWELGRLSDEQTSEVYRGSDINLNFTESSTAYGWKPAAKIFLNRRFDGSVRLNTPRQVVDRIALQFGGAHTQIKARNFEVPGCGGFLLTAPADNLEEYYLPGKEIVIFSSPSDLIEKANYFLSHDTEREAVRVAGQARTLREHTYESRFDHIFRTMGFDRTDRLHNRNQDRSKTASGPA